MVAPYLGTPVANYNGYSIFLCPPHSHYFILKHDSEVPELPNFGTLEAAKGYVDNLNDGSAPIAVPPPEPTAPFDPAPPEQEETREQEEPQHDEGVSE